MKKPIFIIISLGCLLSCSNNNSSSISNENTDKELIEEEEIPVVDTLRLTEGNIPESWVKVTLKDGYYIGFPKKPRKKESKSNQRIDYKIIRSKYRLRASLTDLSKEPSFQQNKKYRTAYYHAIINDLAADIEADVEHQKKFYSQDIYEGIRAIIRAEDVCIYLQCIIIESTLYTHSLTLFAEESSAYLQMRDKFFYSFGNEFYKSRNEIEDSRK